MPVKVKPTYITSNYTTGINGGSITSTYDVFGLPQSDPTMMTEAIRQDGVPKLFSLFKDTKVTSNCRYRLTNYNVKPWNDQSTCSYRVECIYTPDPFLPSPWFFINSTEQGQTNTFYGMDRSKISGFKNVKDVIAAIDFAPKLSYCALGKDPANSSTKVGSLTISTENATTKLVTDNILRNRTIVKRTIYGKDDLRIKLMNRLGCINGDKWYPVQSGVQNNNDLDLALENAPLTWCYFGLQVEPVFPNYMLYNLTNNYPDLPYKLTVMLMKSYTDKKDKWLSNYNYKDPNTNLVPPNLATQWVNGLPVSDFIDPAAVTNNPHGIFTGSVYRIVNFNGGGATPPAQAPATGENVNTNLTIATADQIQALNIANTGSSATGSGGSSLQSLDSLFHDTSYSNNVPEIVL